MTGQLQPESLATLACEAASRPKGAPTIGDIQPSIRSARRDEHQLTVTFDRSATALVGAVVAAERQCCTTIVWELEAAEEPLLRITAGPGQLDVLEAIFAPPHPTS